jgi:hypothetical protein
MTAPLNVQGERFGRLVVVRDGPKRNVTEKRPEGVRTAICECDCGSVTTVLLNNLTRGKVTSCGCARRERTGEWNREAKVVMG